MYEDVKTWTKDEVTCSLRYEPEGYIFDPRDNDNVGVFVCRQHCSYDLPKEQPGFSFEDYDSMDEAIKALEEDFGAKNIHPVWMYDHSGVTFRIGNSNPFSCQWDSSLAGVIYTTDKQIEMMGAAEDRIDEILKLEIEEYADWSEGNVFYYEINYPDGTSNSCGGLIGYDYAVEYVESVFDDYVSDWTDKQNKEKAERDHWAARDVMTA